MTDYLTKLAVYEFEGREMTAYQEARQDVLDELAVIRQKVDELGDLYKRGSGQADTCIAVLRALSQFLQVVIVFLDERL